MISERRVLILFEGKTDRKCLDSLRCLGTFNSLLLQGQYTPVQLNTSIYELYDPLIQSGEYDSLPVYLCHKGLLKCPENVRPQDMFALIYLIFDFDPLYQLPHGGIAIRCGRERRGVFHNPNAPLIPLL